MRGRFSCIIACAASFLAVPSVASAQGDKRDKNVLELEPSSNWHLDYGVDGCRLLRTFGNKEGETLIYLEQDGPSDSFAITLAGDAAEFLRSNKNISMQFGPVHGRQDAKFFIGDLGRFDKAFIFSSYDIYGEDISEDRQADSESEQAKQFSFPQIDPADAANIEWLSFYQQKKRVTLLTGNMKAALVALNTCSRDLLTDWGLDVESQMGVTQPVKWTNRKEIAREIIRNYPAVAVSAGAQGILGMRVMIDEAGMVTSCKLRNFTENDSLNSPACRIMQDAKFTPALDADGAPIASYYQTNIIYQID